MTAQDIKWSIEQTLASPMAGKGLLLYIDKITCPDKYTITFHTDVPRTGDFLECWLGYSTTGGLVVPHEILDTYGKDALVDWRRACGKNIWHI
jgi:ABC-type transport system substrate-binding protein